MVPIAAGAAGVWLTASAVRLEIALLTTLYAASILAFLAGVRRGLSFRTEGGATFVQILSMFVLYCLALFALLAVTHGFQRVAIGVLAAGYAAVAVLDPIAARRGEAPLFFAPLRSTQMPIAAISLLILLANFVTR